MSRRVAAREFLAPLFDAYTELPFPPDADGDGPIGWAGYATARAAARARTGADESVWCGVARLDGIAAVVIAFEFGFLGGSIGQRTGDRLVAAHEHARRHRLPVLSLIATGGSRMQEGMRALSQLQRIVRQSAATRRAGLAQLAVLRDPATGGGWAVLGPSADVILALPGAQVGFAGSRVRPADADPSAYTAESQLAHGHVDAIVPQPRLRGRLARWLRLLGPSVEAGPVPDGSLSQAVVAEPELDRGPTVGRDASDRPPSVDEGPIDHGADQPTRVGCQGPGRSVAAAGWAGRLPSVEAESLADDEVAHSPRVDGRGASRPVPAEVPRALGRSTEPESGWEAVTSARAVDRPRAESYLDDYFDWREPISGDRVGGVDLGLLCGFGRRGGRTIAYAAQTGTATTPAGFRTASRLIRTAQRLSIPVLTLIDTPGAANDAQAERSGAGAAIAELFTVVAESRVPITTLLIGEGGSGGAMALAAPDNTWATMDSYFAVIAPEAATSILKQPAESVGEVADRLRLRPRDLLELGIVRGIATNDD